MSKLFLCCYEMMKCCSGQQKKMMDFDYGFWDTQNEYIKKKILWQC